MKTKAQLPTKICPTCARPFTWRRKWAECWDAVVHCSRRCRAHRTVATIKVAS